MMNQVEFRLCERLFINSFLRGLCSLFRPVCSCQLDSVHQLHYKIQTNRSHSILTDTLYQTTSAVVKKDSLWNA